MSDIFSEVDEEVRKEKSLELWKAYGKYVIGASVLIVGATAAYVGWQSYTKNLSEEQGRQFEAAAQLVTEKKYSDAADAFGALAATGEAGYKALATLRQASALISAGKGADGLAVYDSLAASDADEEFVAAAKVMAGYYLIDNGSPEAVRERVSGMETAGNIWAASAQELLALAAMKDGKTEEAITILNALKDDANAPTGIKGRAEQLLLTLGVK